MSRWLQKNSSLVLEKDGINMEQGMQRVKNILVISFCMSLGQNPRPRKCIYSVKIVSSKFFHTILFFRYFITFAL